MTDTGLLTICMLVIGLFIGYCISCVLDLWVDAREERRQIMAKLIYRVGVLWGLK